MLGIMNIEDHPRSRGVYMTHNPRSPQALGSSPLARGLPALCVGRTCISRIIPARAGFTCERSFRKPAFTDHPRSRGVYGGYPHTDHVEMGSSPLARGLQLSAAILFPSSGIIPARAGFTLREKFFFDCGEDHPRSRGVYCARVRVCAFLSRIIPARAGFTHEQDLRRGTCWDHPRSRGVYFPEEEFRVEGQGSSPLARGLRSDAEDCADDEGIIPARAGFTLADPWNPNDEPCYQTAFTFSANLEPAPPSSGSAVVLRRSTMTPSEA